MNLLARLVKLVILSGAIAPGVSLATNGMNLEGYGPIALGMGGASMAYDNGTAAVMNNPATLGLMAEGGRADFTLGFLGPNVSTKVMNVNESSANAFYMPAVGWAAKSGGLTYGIGMFAQGGMGTEYSASSDLAMGSGDKVRSEVGVGRLILPLAYSPSNTFSIAGSFDVVWAGMDLKMAMQKQQAMPMVDGASAGFGTMLGSLGATDWVRFDFSNNNKFMGEAFGTGYAGKLGILYKPASTVTLGASYHSKTQLNDLTTNNASMSAQGMGPAMSGKVTIKDFQWPETYGLGVAYRANSRWLMAADVKRINWSGVMASFKMNFASGSEYVDITMPQQWKDQTVVALGTAYSVNDKLTLRFGYNRASNPVPAAYLNPLFPATIEKHYTLGFGYAMAPRNVINFALSHAPDVTVTPGAGPVVSHNQTSWQLMYSYLY